MTTESKIDMKVTRYRKEDGITYALGATVVMEYLLHRKDKVLEVIFHPKFNSEDTKEKIRSICTSAGIPVTEEEKPFNILSQKENCFVIGVIGKYDCKLQKGNHVVLVNPSNAGNMGTIMRSALGFGVERIAVIPPAVDHFDPKTIRASMGAAASVEIEVFDTMEDYLARFPENNCYPFMLDGSVLLQKTELKAPFSLIFGNEATGLPASFAKIGAPVRIEHGHKIDSLNLPIAASIALYEATKGFFA